MWSANRCPVGQGEPDSSSSGACSGSGSGVAGTRGRWQRRCWATVRSAALVGWCRRCRRSTFWAACGAWVEVPWVAHDFGARPVGGPCRQAGRLPGGQPIGRAAGLGVEQVGAVVAIPWAWRVRRTPTLAARGSRIREGCSPVGAPCCGCRMPRERGRCGPRTAPRGPGRQQPGRSSVARPSDRAGVSGRVAARRGYGVRGRSFHR